MKPCETNARLNKSHLAIHPKFLAWATEKYCNSETATPLSEGSSSVGNKPKPRCQDDEQTLDLSYSEHETDKTSEHLNRNSTSQLKDLPVNGTSDVETLSPYKGLFVKKCESQYNVPITIDDDSDVQAIDYSMSSNNCRSQSDNKNVVNCHTEKDEWGDKKSSECFEADEEYLYKESCIRRKAYPFLTKELYSPKIDSSESGSLERIKRETDNEENSATVEEIGAEKTNSLLNEFYLPSVVKTEPCDEYNDMSEMQYTCASRLLRHTELPSSPLQLKFTCKTCGEVFKNRQFRDLHVKLHKNAHKFVCTVCGIGFDVEDEYQSHQKLHCEPLLVCQDCGYRCTREFRMKSHREICGQPSKIYKCPFCNKPFAAKRYMNIHMKSHDVRNVNPCPFCPNVYPLKNSLLKHIKKKHGVSKMD